MAEAEKEYSIITVPGTSDVEEKKSHFICELRRVASEEEARAFIDEVKKKHYDARHNCFAMRIGTGKDVFERSGDDGEPQGTAGRPMLEILKGAGLIDICAVVTRYFGGTLLGTGGLVRAYSDSLKTALSASVTEKLWSGARYRITADYKTASRIRTLADNLDLRPEKEEFGEKIQMDYLLPIGKEESFIKNVTEISSGAVVPEKTEAVLCFGTEHPKVYRQE